jgi:RPA family protein
VNTPTIVPDTPDNPDPDPATDNYSNLILSDVGTQQEDGTYIPKIQAQYTPPTTDMKEHVINWWHEGESVSEKKVSPQVKDVLLSDGIQTGVALTVRVWGTDLNGKPRSGVIGQITPGKDSVAPGAPTSLTATGWFGEIVLDWANPETNEDGTPCTDLSHVEVWESSEDDIETAVLVGKVNGTHFQRHLGSFEGRYYWVRAVDTSGNVSQWNAEAGVYGYSEQESHEDFINALLEENPLIQELWDSLGTEIDGVSEERIQDILGSLDQFYLLMFQQRQAEKDAEALIEEALGNYEDMKYSVAIVAEERTTRETAEEALAQAIDTVAAMIGDPNNPGSDTVWAGIYEEKTARATADEAMAGHILDISAGIGDPLNPEDGTVYAAIRKEAIARVSGDESSATEIDTLYSQLGTTNAAIQNESITRAAQDSALSSQISTVQNTVGENTTKIQQSATVIDGIKGEWTVKIDSNGSVAGIGLINGPTGSAFIVRSDSFWIGRPGTTIREAPFVVGTVDGITKVSMSNAFIQDAAISSAKIKDLTIGRIKLASGIDAGLSWGNSSFYDGDQSRTGSGTFTPAGGSCSIRTESRGRVLVSGFVGARHWNGSITVYLKRDGSIVRTLGSYGGGAYDPVRTFFAFYVDEYPGNSVMTYSISISYSGEATYVQGCGLSVMAFYR